MFRRTAFSQTARRLALFVAVTSAASGCAAPRPAPGYGYGQYGGAPASRARAGFPEVAYATWNDDEPSYRLYPGDQIDVSFNSAPELSKTLTVEPDGRISLPYVQPVMVADRTPQQAEAALSAACAPVLVHPEASVSVRATTPIKVFVGGEVSHPGVYDMPGDINALQAVLMAGGFTIGAKPSQVVVLRRGADGQAMMRTVDLTVHGRHTAVADLLPLRRFDVVYATRSNVAEAGLFMQQYARDLMPIQFGYTISSRAFLTTK